MKISKLLNKNYLSIFVILFILLNSFVAAEDEPVDIWNLEKKVEQNSSVIVSENDESNEIKIEVEKSDPNSTINTIDSDTLKENDTSIVGLYDPDDHGLSGG